MTIFVLIMVFFNKFCLANFIAYLCRGSVVAKIVGYNVRGKNAFTETVSMYVHDEIVNGQKLSDIINMRHENVKYLPGCKLPENVVRSLVSVVFLGC